MRSPKSRILRDFKSNSLRRSPRKLYSPEEEELTKTSPHLTPRKGLRLQPTTPQKKESSSLTPRREVPVRQSPRKHALSRPGFSKLTITANSILNCPSPATS